ncbi:hypothetical protein C0583_00535 [Candidatus Parcubacteria bacterium]|nr:MAG: hypothetical protein C0583_00535 [Candidatus Parcubacteria bacterium]
MNLKWLKKIKDNSAFTMLESLVILAAMVFIFTVSMISYRSYDMDLDLKSQIDQITMYFALARQKTISSHENDSWGLRISTSSSPQIVTLFKGKTYDTRDSSVDYLVGLNTNVNITDFDFEGSDWTVFNRISGRASSTGYISMEHINDSSKSATIYLNKEGLTSLHAFPSQASTTANIRLVDSRHIHIEYSRTINVASENIILTFDGGTVIETIPMANYLEDGQFVWSGVVNIASTSQELEIRSHEINNPNTLFSIHRDIDKNNVSLEVDISGDTWPSPQLISYSDDGATVATGSSPYIESIIRQ